ncbi:MAG: hypothetical protein MUC49_08740 [Raineya sp.]|nr:hypothetical protein [Raineya sp.]
MKTNFFKRINLLPFFLGFLIVFTLESCQSHNPPRRRNGKMPKSGRIPCPIKDC